MSVNGQPVASIALSGGYGTYDVPVSSHMLGRGLNRIELRYGYAMSPREAGIGEDDRILAVRFDTLDFGPMPVD